MTFDRAFLERQGYLSVVDCGDGRWAGVMIFMFTVAIVTGSNEDASSGYEDRWCYGSLDGAIEGLNQWALNDFVGEPQGWHRHPATGRRRVNGSIATEYINP